MKEVDDTPVTESRSEENFEFCVRMIGEESTRLKELKARVVELEHALALLQEERVTVRAPEATDDPEWF
jgi:BMFP domain-containing protein YqiC